MRFNKQTATLLAGAFLLMGSAGSAQANYTWSFDGTVGGISLSPSSSDQSTNIAQWMDKVIGGSCATLLNCVTVSGVGGSGGVAVDTTYAGDGHVVGPGGVPLTLGNSNNATNNSATPSGTYDNFLSNTTNGASQLSTGILITFSQGISLTGTFTVDYEIFPDGTCAVVYSSANPTACGGVGNPNLPDLSFSANGSTPVSTTLFGATPANPGPNGNSTASSAMGAETAPQWIGTYTTTLHGATSLQFLDWPATIGIDNLKLVTTPEPRGEAFLLGALGLAALAGIRLRRSLAKS